MTFQYRQSVSWWLLFLDVLRVAIFLNFPGIFLALLAPMTVYLLLLLSVLQIQSLCAMLDLHLPYIPGPAYICAYRVLAVYLRGLFLHDKPV